MDNKKNISLQVEEDLLKEFDDFCKAIGLTRAATVTLFMKYCATYGELPFTPGRKNENKERDHYDFEPVIPMLL